MAVRYHIAQIMQQFLGEYRQQFSLSLQQRRVCEHLMSCRTTQLEAQYWQCDHCHHMQTTYAACRDRHCPRCQFSQAAQWVEQQQEAVLNCRYFHLVFTLPAEAVQAFNGSRSELYQQLFSSAWQSVQAFARNRKGLQGQAGMTCVLHTWGQTLTQHIHLHCLVPGGVLTNDAAWREVKQDYLFPVKALSRKFRGHFLAGAKINSQSVPSKWVVYSKRCLMKTETVLAYLGRYIRKIAISESRIQHIDDESVKFRYLDYREHHNKSMTLTGVEFLRRYLSHVLPKGFVRVRHYGFLANCCRKKKVKLIREYQSTEQEMQAEKAKTDVSTSACNPLWLCPHCHKGHMVLCDIDGKNHNTNSGSGVNIDAIPIVGHSI